MRMGRAKSIRADSLLPAIKTQADAMQMTVNERRMRMIELL
jgi:hypothetical protein